MADFNLKRHDTAPAIQCTLQDSTGAAINLAGASVKFIMVAVGGGGTPKVNAAATIVTPTSGVVKYTWLTTDTDTSGQYNAEWQVTFADSSKETFPDPGYLVVSITDDLDNA